MYYEEHNPPHFHSEYQGFKAVFLIETGEMIQGRGFPIKAKRLVQEWCLEHKKELVENWKLMEEGKALFRIPGADQ